MAGMQRDGPFGSDMGWGVLSIGGVLYSHRSLQGTEDIMIEPAPAQYVQPMRLRGKIVRDDFQTGQMVGAETDLFREPDGSWRVDQQAFPVEWVRVTPTTSTVRVRPTWATVLGILLLCTLIGIALFFVKEDRVVPSALVEVCGVDGRMLVFTSTTEPTALRAQLGAH
jgi:hypothetical protein